MAPPRKEADAPAGSGEDGGEDKWRRSKRIRDAAEKIKATEETDVKGHKPPPKKPRMAKDTALGKGKRKALAHAEPNDKDDVDDEEDDAIDELDYTAVKGARAGAPPKRGKRRRSGSKEVDSEAEEEKALRPPAKRAKTSAAGKKTLTAAERTKNRQAAAAKGLATKRARKAARDAAEVAGAEKGENDEEVGESEPEREEPDFPIPPALLHPPAPSGPSGTSHAGPSGSRDKDDVSATELARTEQMRTRLLRPMVEQAINNTLDDLGFRERMYQDLVTRMLQQFRQLPPASLFVLFPQLDAAVPNTSAAPDGGVTGTTEHTGPTGPTGLTERTGPTGPTDPDGTDDAAGLSHTGSANPGPSEAMEIDTHPAAAETEDEDAGGDLDEDPKTGPDDEEVEAGEEKEDEKEEEGGDNEGGSDGEEASKKDDDDGDGPGSPGPPGAGVSDDREGSPGSCDSHYSHARSQTDADHEADRDTDPDARPPPTPPAADPTSSPLGPPDAHGTPYHSHPPAASPIHASRFPDNTPVTFSTPTAAPDASTSADVSEYRDPLHPHHGLWYGDGNSRLSTPSTPALHTTPAPPPGPTARRPGGLPRGTRAHGTATPTATRHITDDIVGRAMETGLFNRRESAVGSAPRRQGMMNTSRGRGGPGYGSPAVPSPLGRGAPGGSPARGLTTPHARGGPSTLVRPGPPPGAKTPGDETLEYIARELGDEEGEGGKRIEAERAAEKAKAERERKDKEAEEEESEEE